MRRRIVARAALALALAIASPALLAAGFHVVFINPGRSDEPFWRSATRFMQPAARQLGIELEVLYADRDHLKMITLAQQVTQRPRKPDYLMIVNEKLAAGEMLKLAEQARIPALLVFNSFEEAQADEFGQPREKYRYWLGSLTPNAADAGMATAAELTRQALRRHAVAGDGKVHVAMIAGDKVTPTGLQRVEGAAAVFRAHGKVVLEQVVYGNWDRARAQEQAAALLLRYPMLNAIWTASDLMAFGAMEAAQAAGRKPGSDLLFSAINNSPEVLRARLQDRICALAGGHFTTGGFGLVMLYDYHHGKDFRDEGLQPRAPLFVLLDKELAQRFLTRFGDEDFSSVDFRRFSKHLNPGLRRYRFGLLQALRR